MRTSAGYPAGYLTGYPGPPAGTQKIFVYPGGICRVTLLWRGRLQLLLKPPVVEKGTLFSCLAFIEKKR